MPEQNKFTYLIMYVYMYVPVPTYMYRYNIWNVGVIYIWHGSNMNWMFTDICQYLFTYMYASIDYQAIVCFSQSNWHTRYGIAFSHSQSFLF